MRTYEHINLPQKWNTSLPKFGFDDESVFTKALQLSQGLGFETLQNPNI